MAWNSTWPDGSQSVKTNQSTGAANTTYVKTTMNVDHYWDNSGNNDGHHQWVQMTQSGTAAVPVDIALATGMEGGFYSKAKSATEAPDNQDVQPFFINNKSVGVAGVTEVMQVPGVRSCGLVTIVAGAPYVLTTKYAHNLTSITRHNVGVYDVTFPALPTAFYLPYVMALGAGAAGSSVYATIDASTKSTTSMRILIQNTALDLARIDPAQLWFFVFGG